MLLAELLSLLIAVLEPMDNEAAAIGLEVNWDKLTRFKLWELTIIDSSSSSSFILLTRYKQTFQHDSTSIHEHDRQQLPHESDQEVLDVHVHEVAVIDEFVYFDALTHSSGHIS